MVAAVKSFVGCINNVLFLQFYRRYRLAVGISAAIHHLLKRILPFVETSLGDFGGTVVMNL